MDAGVNRGGLLRSKVVDNNAPGFEQLLAFLQKHDVKELHVCMEATGVYWESVAQYLADHGFTVSVVNPAGQEVASLSLIEAMDTHFDFTIHLRGPEPVGAHDLRMQVFYLESDEPGAARQVVDERTLTFSPAAEAPSP